MKTNRSLPIVLAALALLVAGSGLSTQMPGDASAAPRAVSWADAFPVAQAGFATAAK